YGRGQNGSVRLTRYHNHDVLVINIEQRIFGERASPALLPAAPAAPVSPVATDLSERHLLLIHSPQGELIGIPLETPPTLRRVAESAFAPVPPTYLAEGGIRCVSAIVSPSEQEPPIFLINPHQLLQPGTALPPT
ncbi:MAG TPA: chemotaxis protein CheW, partial [Allocoleopsis sp.]